MKIVNQETNHPMREKKLQVFHRRTSGSSGQINFAPFLASNHSNNFALAPKLKLNQKDIQKDFIQKKKPTRGPLEALAPGKNNYYMGMRKSTKVFQKYLKPNVQRERMSYVQKSSQKRKSSGQVNPLQNCT